MPPVGPGIRWWNGTVDRLQRGVFDVVEAAGSFDPVTAGLFGALGALAVVLLTLTGYIAGRRNS